MGPPGEGLPAGEAEGGRMAYSKVVGALAAGTATRRARARWVRVRSGTSAYGAEVVSTSSSPEDVPAPDVRPAGLSVVVIPGNPGTAGRLPGPGRSQQLPAVGGSQPTLRSGMPPMSKQRKEIFMWGPPVELLL